MSTTLEKALDTREAASFIGLKAGTLENMRIIGNGPRFIKHGNRVVYDPADIKVWLEARKIGSTSEQVAA